MDDGPSTVEASLRLAEGAYADGITTIAATPHVDWAHAELHGDEIAARVRTFQRQLDRAEIPITVVAGGELAATRAVDTSDVELSRLALGTSPWLLLECPLGSTVTPGFPDAARSLVRRGHRVLLAHPERCPLFMRAPALLNDLIADGMLVQLTAGSVAGRFGRPVREFARALLDRGVAHVIASDGHGGHRPAKIAAELAASRVDQALIEWVARDVPSALLAGEAVPPRPAVITRRRARRMRRMAQR